MVNGKEKVGAKERQGEEKPGQLHTVQMTDQQVMEYMQSLVQGEHPDLSEMEKEVLGMFRAASQEAGTLQQRLQRVVQEKDRLADRIKNLAGQCDGYANLLVKMKEQRDAEQIRKQFDESGKGADKK